MGAAAIPLAVAGAGVLMQAVGAQGQADFQAKQLEHQAAIAEMNANLQRRKSLEAKEAGTVQEDRRRARARLEAGDARAAAAARGVVVDEGSQFQHLQDIYDIGERDALTIRNNAARAEADLLTSANQLENNAEAQRESAQHSEDAGDFAFKATLLTGIGGLANTGYVNRKWYNQPSSGGKQQWNFSPPSTTGGNN